MEYSNFSSDDVFVQAGQIIGNLEVLDPDDSYVHAFTSKERREGVKLDDLMSKIPSDYMETDEIEVGLSQKDVGINAVSDDKPLPQGF